MRDEEKRWAKEEQEDLKKWKKKRRNILYYFDPGNRELFYGLTKHVLTKECRPKWTNTITGGEYQEYVCCHGKTLFFGCFTYQAAKVKAAERLPLYIEEAEWKLKEFLKPSSRPN